MNKSSAENTFLIHHLKTLQREIPIEGEAQQATIARMFVYTIPEIVEKINRLEMYESGKDIIGSTKETHPAPFQL